MWRRMKAKTRRWLVAVAACVLGCELDAELGTYTAPDGAATGTETDGSGAPGSTGEEGRGDAGSGGTEGGDGDGDTGAGICMIDGSETACQICLEHLCCEQLENCDVEMGCFCMLECLAQSDPVTCAMTCTPDLAYFQLIQCRATSCAAVCE
jgi:hypothetical protein